MDAILHHIAASTVAGHHQAEAGHGSIPEDGAILVGNGSGIGHEGGGESMTQGATDIMGNDWKPEETKNSSKCRIVIATFRNK